MSTPGQGAPQQESARARRFPRFCTDVRVVITPSQADTSQPVHGRCTIIAQGGFGATLAGELPIGSEVEAELVLVGGCAPIKANAVLRYRYGFRHGFEFSAIGPEDRDVIRDFCAHLQYAK